MLLLVLLLLPVLPTLCSLFAPPPLDRRVVGEGVRLSLLFEEAPPACTVGGADFGEELLGLTNCGLGFGVGW